MEKKILLEQLDHRIQKALSLIVYLYPRMKAHGLELEEVRGLIQIVDGLKCLVSAVADIEYNDNIEHYRDVIYEIAKDGRE